MKKQRSIRLLVAVCFLMVTSMTFFTGVAHSEYPERPITLMVGYNAGGMSDILMRALVPGVGSYLNQQFVVLNKPGAASTVALGVLATAKPDGYTLCFAPSAALADTPIKQKVPFKPLKDLTCVAVIASGEHNGTLVRKDAPWKTFEELIDYAKKNPGKIKYGATGVGSRMHAAMEAVAQKEGIKWVFIPYTGIALGRAALLGGHIDVLSHDISFPPFVEAGQFRVLATHGSKRSPRSPDVPTLKELGYDFVNDVLFMIVGPAGLPAEVIAKLETAFLEGTKTPEYIAAREKLCISAEYLNCEECNRDLKERWPRVEEMLKKLGVIEKAASQPY